MWITRNILLKSTFLGAFAKLWKATITFVMCQSVCLSVCHHVTTRLPLDGFSCNLDYFSKICRENCSLIKTDKNNRCFSWKPIYFCYHISLISSKNDKCFRHTCRGNQNTHFMFSNIFFPENHPAYVIMWYVLYSRSGHRWKYLILDMFINCNWVSTRWQ